MIKLQILPETQVPFRVEDTVVKTESPVITPRYITENGVYSAKAEGVTGYDPVTVDVDMTPAYNAGRQAEYDCFWDAFQQAGNRDSYQYAFSNFWYAENFRPKYDIRSANDGSSMNYAFNYFNHGAAPIDLAQVLDSCGVRLDLSQATGLISTFNYANVSRLPVLDLRNCTSFNSPLNRCEAITIDKIILADDGSQNVNGLFTWNQKCQNITIEGCIGKSFSTQWNTAFTVTSLQSFVDALKDLTGEATQTVTFSGTVGKKLTEAQKAMITAKNWTLVY